MLKKIISAALVVCFAFSMAVFPAGASEYGGYEDFSSDLDSSLWQVT